MNGLSKKTRRSGIGTMASNAIGLSTVKSLRGTVHLGSQVTVRRAGDTRAERDRQWRYFAGAQVDGSQRMDKSKQSRRSRKRTQGTRITDSNASRLATRLQPVRMHPLSTQLRSEKNRCGSRQFSHYGLHGVRRESRTAPDRNQTGQLATRKESRTLSRHGTNGIPATGRSRPKTSRHGTKSKAKSIEIADFVPPRDKTPCFWGVHRPATGHLYRLTICSEISGATP